MVRYTGADSQGGGGKGSVADMQGAEMNCCTAQTKHFDTMEKHLHDDFNWV
jgi:hypothetical protein